MERWGHFCLIVVGANMEVQKCWRGGEVDSQYNAKKRGESHAGLGENTLLTLHVLRHGACMRMNNLFSRDSFKTLTKMMVVVDMQHGE